MSDTWTIYTDGGARGNPGPAAYAYVIKRPGQADIEQKCFIERATNNVAEYTGMIKALEHAKQLGGRKLLIHSDSELMVKQMNGQYRVKNAGLLPLYQQAVALREQFDAVTIKHIYREQNAQADALCNEAMDARAPGEPSRVSGRVVERASDPMNSKKTASESPPANSGATPLMRALALLQQSAKHWSESGDPSDPAPGEVLAQILEITRERNAITS